MFRTCRKNTFFYVVHIDHFFLLRFPKDSESLKTLDLWLQEVGAKRRLNGTSKVNTHTNRQTHRRTFRLIESIGPEGWCFEKMFWRRRQNCFRFIVVDLPPHSPLSQPNKIPHNILKISWGTPPRKSSCGCRSAVLICLLKEFLQNSWSCPQAYCGASRRQKLLLDGATNLLSII